MAIIRDAGGAGNKRAASVINSRKKPMMREDDLNKFRNNANKEQEKKSAYTSLITKPKSSRKKPYVGEGKSDFEVKGPVTSKDTNQQKYTVAPNGQKVYKRSKTGTPQPTRPNVQYKVVDRKSTNQAREEIQALKAANRARYNQTAGQSNPETRKPVAETKTPNQSYSSLITRETEKMKPTTPKQDGKETVSTKTKPPKQDGKEVAGRTQPAKQSGGKKKKSSKTKNSGFSGSPSSKNPGGFGGSSKSRNPSALNGKDKTKSKKPHDTKAQLLDGFNKGKKKKSKKKG